MFVAHAYLSNDVVIVIFINVHPKTLAGVQCIPQSSTNDGNEDNLMLQNFAKWAHINLNFAKCAIIGSLNKAKLQPTIFKAYLQALRIMHQKKEKEKENPKCYHYMNHTLT